MTSLILLTAVVIRIQETDLSQSNDSLISRSRPANAADYRLVAFKIQLSIRLELAKVVTQAAVGIKSWFVLSLKLVATLFSVNFVELQCWLTVACNLLLFGPRIVLRRVSNVLRVVYLDRQKGSEQAVSLVPTDL